MPSIELLFFPSCPHIDAARSQLRAALRLAGRDETWTERDVTAADAPAHTRGYGSPTILVDGRDVSGVGPCAGQSCRVYTDSEVRGAPSVAAISSALRARRSPL
jgi:hypothetical protein